MLYSVKVRSQNEMQDSTQCLASLTKEKRWTQSRVYKITGFRLHKMPTTLRPLRQPQVLVYLVFEEGKTPPRLVSAFPRAEKPALQGTGCLVSRR